MSEKTYDPIKAAKAQESYCDQHEIPHFAPSDGYCYMCNRNIYSLGKYNDGSPCGISVEEASSKLITGCPYCHYSFVE